MIYSKFGTQLRLVSRHSRTGGQLTIQATAGETPEIREYSPSELKADGGLAEINDAIAMLPWKVPAGKKPPRGQQFRAALPGTRSAR